MPMPMVTVTTAGLSLAKRLRVPAGAVELQQTIPLPRTVIPVLRATMARGQHPALCGAGLRSR